MIFDVSTQHELGLVDHSNCMRYMGRSICRLLFELTQQRREFNCLQRADSCFPTTLRTEALYTRILVCLKDRFKACVSNAFRKIFQFHNSSHR